MENKAPDSSFASRTVERAPTIGIYDNCPAQRAIICEILSRIGARAIKVTYVHPPKYSPKCCVAIVGIGTEIHDEELQIIRELKAMGFRIIACGDGVASWSVKLR